ncbi:MAG: protein kinase [Anaerolineae bacterium]
MPRTCPQCGAANRDTARFCSRCSTPLTPAAVCPNCGSSCSPTARFCSGCGWSLQTTTPPYGLGTGRLPAKAMLKNRYIIIRKIGQGGMAAVYQAADTRITGKTWAVKEMSDAAITDPLEKQQALLAFRQEASLLAKLDHPHIPRVTDYFSKGGKQYLVMEYIEGQTLEEILEQRGRPFSEHEVRPWLEQLCDVLDYLHCCSPPVVFRDLKPANIMMDQMGQIKLIDFGIARLFKSGKTSDTQVLGTPGYAAPEQHGQKQSDARSDVYALGVTLHRLLTNHDPVATPFSLPPLRQLAPTLSDAMDRIVQRATEKDPDRRWQSAAEIKQFILGKVPSPGAPPVGAGQALPKTSRPTTRLLLAVAQVSNEQLAMVAGGMVVLFALATCLLGPFIFNNLPWLWHNFPLYLVAAPMTYAASQRRGSALLSHVPVACTVWLIIQWKLHIYESGLWPLLVASIVSGLTMEGWLMLKKKEITNVWWQDCLWTMAAAVLGYMFFIVVLQQSVKGLYFQVGELFGAAPVGGLGWFIGDLYQQNTILRQTGVPRIR